MDDDPLVRQIMHRQLAICGFEVTTAAHGEDAVAASRQAREDGRPFDAVIMDLLVPTGWGGEQTLADLLKFDPEVKALVCSGTLGKPFSFADLRAEVEEVIHMPKSVRAGFPVSKGTKGTLCRGILNQRTTHFVNCLGDGNCAYRYLFGSGFFCVPGEKRDFQHVQDLNAGS